MFSPPKSSKYTLIQQRPTPLHMIAYVTGGLEHLYKEVQNNNVSPPAKEGDFTDDDGAFSPQPDMPLMASRYQFLRLLGKGQSSVLIKVKDVFQDGALRSIKVLHTHYSLLGVQESDCVRRINLADSYDTSATLRLCNTFSYHSHYCMVFELLSPEPLTYYFKEMRLNEVIPAIRKVTLRLLQALGFLQQQNVIHADLKPTNILLKKEPELNTVKVVDFGNAIHCIHEELSLYYDDFELQTLLYRAPEVVFGLSFGLEVDIWSLGCVLAELYLNRPLFCGSDKSETLTNMTDFLGPLPEEVFKRGKFFPELCQFTCRSSDHKPVTTPELMEKMECNDYPFVDFLRLLLLYNPHERLTVADAARHPFLAPEVGFGYVMSTSADQGYPSVLLDHQNYVKRPFIDEQRKRQRLSSTDLLREGTCVTPTAVTKVKVAYVMPMSKSHNQDINLNGNNSNNIVNNLSGSSLENHGIRMAVERQDQIASDSERFLARQLRQDVIFGSRTVGATNRENTHQNVKRIIQKPRAKYPWSREVSDLPQKTAVTKNTLNAQRVIQKASECRPGLQLPIQNARGVACVSSIKVDKATDMLGPQVSRMNHVEPRNLTAHTNTFPTSGRPTLSGMVTVSDIKPNRHHSQRDVTTKLEAPSPANNEIVKDNRKDAGIPIVADRPGKVLKTLSSAQMGAARQVSAISLNNTYVVQPLLAATSQDPQVVRQTLKPGKMHNSVATITNDTVVEGKKPKAHPHSRHVAKCIQPNDNVLCQLINPNTYSETKNVPLNVVHRSLPMNSSSSQRQNTTPTNLRPNPNAGESKTMSESLADQHDICEASQRTSNKAPAVTKSRRQHCLQNSGERFDIPSHDSKLDQNLKNSRFTNNVQLKGKKSSRSDSQSKVMDTKNEVCSLNNKTTSDNPRLKSSTMEDGFKREKRKEQRKNLIEPDRNKKQSRTDNKCMSRHTNRSTTSVVSDLPREEEPVGTPITAASPDTGSWQSLKTHASNPTQTARTGSLRGTDGDVHNFPDRSSDKAPQLKRKIVKKSLLFGHDTHLSDSNQVKQRPGQTQPHQIAAAKETSTQNRQKVSHKRPCAQTGSVGRKRISKLDNYSSAANPVKRRKTNTPKIQHEQQTSENRQDTQTRSNNRVSGNTHSSCKRKHIRSPKLERRRTPTPENTTPEDSEVSDDNYDEVVLL